MCEIYALLYNRGLISFPITEEGKRKVDAIVANITTTYFEVERYATAEEKAVAYLYFLIKDHPFTDGNKRTAVLSFKVFCSINNLKPDENKFGFDELAVYVEQLKEEDHQQMIRLIAAVLFGQSFLS